MVRSRSFLRGTQKKTKESQLLCVTASLFINQILSLLKSMCLLPSSGHTMWWANRESLRRLWNVCFLCACLLTQAVYPQCFLHANGDVSLGDGQLAFVWIISRVFLPFVFIFLFHSTHCNHVFFLNTTLDWVTSVRRWNWRHRRILATLPVLFIGQHRHGVSIVSEKLIPNRQSAAAARTAPFY